MIFVAVEEALAAHNLIAGQTLLSRKAVAERLHVDVSTLWRWARAGYPLRPVKLGKAVWYKLADVEKLENGGMEI